MIARVRCGGAGDGRGGEHRHCSVIRTRARAVAATAALLVFGAVMLLRPLPQAYGGALAYAVMAGTATAACVLLLRQGPPALRRARRLVAAVLLVGALAGVLAAVLHLVTGAPAPVPSVVDAVHLLFLPLGVLALLAYPTRAEEPGSVRRSLLDGALASLALWFLAYALLLEPADVGDGLPLAAQLTALAYPTVDLFVLGVLVGVLSRVTAEARRELTLTGAGFALYCVSDIAYSVTATSGTYRPDGVVSVLAEAGLLLVLLGAADTGVRPVPDRAVRALSVLPQVPVLLVLVLVASTVLEGDGIDGPLLACALAMTCALLARQSVGTRDRLRLTARLQAREELFRSLVNGGSDLITLTDATGTVLWASPAVARTVGRTEIEGETLLDSVHPDDRARLTDAALAARHDADGQVEVLCRLGAPDGWRWMQVRFQDRTGDPAVGGLICNARDVHERHLLEQQLSHAAHHDTLTGLGNLARARQLLGRGAAAQGASAAVLLVDLDGFKAVNDTFGHAHGDALLREVSVRLVSCLRDGDEVARLGGDEFLVLLADARHVDVVGRRVLAALREPVLVAGTELSVSASIGAAAAADAGSPDELLRNADLAMYAAKDAGRDQLAEYEPAMHQRASHRMDVSRRLRRALDQDLLALHYQPIVQLADGRVVGAEALLRWQDAGADGDGPELSTAELIGVAEESGLIAEVDVWVLERACRDLAAWRAAGVVVPRISINVSRRHMTADLPRLVEQALRRYRLDGESLCVEVTESAVVADVDVATAALERLRELGVAVALDDFGTGQSSLSQLARLPVDAVKLDMSFTQPAVEDGEARSLLLAVLQVCRSLSLPVVAEGVELPELAALLREAGCERGQGWHFGRPLAAAAFAGALPAPCSDAPAQRCEADREGARTA